MADIETVIARHDLMPLADVAEYVSETQDLADEMAWAVDAEPVEITIPAHGFLNQPLTNEERLRLDEELGPAYTAESVELQERSAQVPIEESGERMVSLRETFDRAELPVFYSEKPFHPACGEWAGKERVFWTREAVAGRLAVAVSALNAIGMTLKFQDVFRPLGVQEGLVRRRITDFILPQHPDMPWEEVLAEARSKTGTSPVISGHKGGASVDATLCTLDGEDLPLGHEYPEGGALVVLDFPLLTPEQWRTRQLFRAAMTIGGLTVYPGEDWHASYGDTMAATGDNYVARYGPLKGFDQETGAVQPYDPSEYHKPFFTEGELRQIAAK